MVVSALRKLFFDTWNWKDSERTRYFYFSQNSGFQVRRLNIAVNVPIELKRVGKFLHSTATKFFSFEIILGKKRKIGTYPETCCCANVIYSRAEVRKPGPLPRVPGLVRKQYALLGFFGTLQ